MCTWGELFQCWGCITVSWVSSLRPLYVWVITAKERMSYTVRQDRNEGAVWAKGSVWWSYTPFILKYSRTNQTFRETIWEPMVQYYQELADLCYENNSLQPRLGHHDHRSEAPHKSLRVICERLEAYWSSTLSWQLHLDLYLTPGVVEFLMEFAQYVNETLVFMLLILSTWFCWR